MTIAARNRIILIGAGIVALFTTLCILSIVYLSRVLPLSTLEFDGQASIASLLLSIMCELIFSATGIVILYFSFRKTASPEIFLFILFLVSMSFDSLKALHILLESTVTAPYYATLATKGVLFGRFFGVLCLFGCGLFATGLPYERLEVALISGLLLSFAMAATIPIDMTNLQRHYVLSTAFEDEISVIAVVLYCFGAANFVLAAFQSANRDYLLVCLGMVMTIVGRELLFYRTDGLSIIVAFVLLITGSTLFSERTHEVHLWA